MILQTMLSGREKAANGSQKERLIVRDLCKSFRTAEGRDLEVLRGVSFSVEPGEVVAIVGASGAGKSTLLNGIGGLQDIDSGAISIGDFNIDRAGGPELARFRNARLGFVFQFHHLLHDLTVAENVALPLLIGRASRKQALKQATELLEECGIAEREKHLAGELSGGEKQRVAIARALIMKPALVLADEPTGNLDTAVGSEISSLLLRFCHEHHSAAVIVTHNLDISNQCDRKFRLKDGRLFES